MLSPARMRSKAQFLTTSVAQHFRLMNQHLLYANAMQPFSGGLWVHYTIGSFQ